MPDRRMGPCSRFFGGWVNLLAYTYDQIAPFWQTPREVEWAKAAADGLAEREAEEEVAEPHAPQYVGYVDSDGVTRVERAGGKYDDAMERHHRAVRGLHEAITALVPETSATTSGAESGPAEGEPPEPSAGVDWLGRSDRDSLWRLSGVHDPAEAVKYGWHDDCWSWTDDGGETWRPSHGQRGVILPAPSGEQWIKVRSAEVEPPASAPSVESPAPEFDWVTTAIPVIAGVLGDHIPVWSIGPWTVYCEHVGGELCAEFADMQDWQDHVSPIIAACLQLQTPRTTTTYDFPSGDRPRPLADFPKHQTPRM